MCVSGYLDYILNNLEKATATAEPDYEPSAIAHSDFIREIIDRYRLEVDAGVKK
jgi:hypothetical protein